MLKADVIIIGAGFAGAAVAWHLADRGVKNIILLEREDMPGVHASGQNASMIRQFDEDEAIARTAFKGAGFVLTPPFEWQKIVNRVGSLMLFMGSRLPKIKRALDFSLGLGLEASLITKKEAISKVPLLCDAEFERAIFTATDGIVDIHNFLWSYLKDAKAAGAKIEFKRTALGIKKVGSTFTVVTETGIFSANSVVNAAGAWSGEVAAMAGAVDAEIVPFRRHLYNTSVMKNVDPSWPFVWDIDHQYYFRPESGGLLIGPCDEERASPGFPSTSYLVREILAEKLGNFCPGLASVKIASEWAGLRTFAPDRRFIIGADPLVKGFYWAAGLGGHGVTCSHKVGKMVADAILKGGETTPPEFSPSRFL